MPSRSDPGFSSVSERDRGSLSSRLEPQLPRPRDAEAMLGRHRPGRPAHGRPAFSRWRQLLLGSGLAAAGALLLVGLMLIPQRFDGLLLVSRAIADLIAGLQRLGYGLIQLTVVLLVALLALLALLLLAGGLVRIVRALIGRPFNRGVAPATVRPAAMRTRGTRPESTIATRRDDGVAGWSSLL